MPNTPSIDYRERARFHFNRANDLLAKNDRAELIYSCLELRMSIEALAYEKVQLYRSDLSDEDMQIWQPSKLMKAIVGIDPDAEADTVVEIGLNEDGTRGPKTLTFTDNRMKAHWAGKAHNALGSFLHEKTLLAIERNPELNDDRVRAKATEIAGEIGRILASNGWNWRPQQLYTVQCECGEAVKMALAFRQQASRVQCKVCGCLLIAERHNDEAGTITVTIEPPNPA